MKASIHKKILYVFLAGAISTAVIAVVAIMTGGFNETVGKTILTLALLIAHTVATIILLENIGADKDPEEDRLDVSDLQIASTSALALTAASLLVSILGTWELLEGEPVSQIYGTMFIVLFAVVHGEALWHMRVSKVAKALTPINLGFIAAVASMLAYTIWVDGNPSDLFFRSLASLAIIDATLTLTITVIYSIYLKTLPKSKKLRRLGLVSRFFWAFVFIFFVLPFLSQLVFILFSF